MTCWANSEARPDFIKDRVRCIAVCEVENWSGTRSIYSSHDNRKARPLLRSLSKSGGEAGLILLLVEVEVEVEDGIEVDGGGTPEFGCVEGLGWDLLLCTSWSSCKRMVEF